tara:strand:+ start:139 stop:318 length:180 start_codon:yes stop_codon:yes gene_type:complete
MDNFIVKGVIGKYRFGYLRIPDQQNVWGVLTTTGRFIKSRDQHLSGAAAETRILIGADA